MSNEAIILRMRKARESCRAVGEFKFTILRPTDHDVSQFMANGATTYDVARDFTIGWSGVKGSDVLKGESSEPIEFDRLLWEVWIADTPAFWEPLHNAIMDAYTAHQKKRTDKAKN